MSVTFANETNLKASTLRGLAKWEHEDFLVLFAVLPLLGMFDCS